MNTKQLKPLCDGTIYQSPSLKCFVLNGVALLQSSITGSESESFTIGDDINI